MNFASLFFFGFTLGLFFGQFYPPILLMKLQKKLLFKKKNPQNQTFFMQINPELCITMSEKTTAIRHAAVREAGVSRNYGVWLRALLKPMQPSQHNRIEGFEGTFYWSPFSPGLLDSRCYFFRFPETWFIYIFYLFLQVRIVT